MNNKLVSAWPDGLGPLHNSHRYVMFGIRIGIREWGKYCLGVVRCLCPFGETAQKESLDKWTDREDGGAEEQDGGRARE